MTDKHTLAPPELAERALVEELATQMALAAGYAPHCWPTWEQEATVIIPTIAKHMATRITALEAEKAELVADVMRLEADNRFFAESVTDFHRVCKANTVHHEITVTGDVTAAFNRLYGHVVNLARATLAKHQGEGK